MILSLIIHHDISKTYLLTKHLTNLKQPPCPETPHFEWEKVTQNYLLNKLIQFDINNIDTTYELLSSNFQPKCVCGKELTRDEAQHFYGKGHGILCNYCHANINHSEILSRCKNRRYNEIIVLSVWKHIK